MGSANILLKVNKGILNRMHTFYPLKAFAEIHLLKLPASNTLEACGF